MLLRGDIVFWCLVIVVAIIVLGVVSLWARRWLSDDSNTDSGPAFTLQDLRDMRKRGELSDTEFETMRAGMLGAYAFHRPGSTALAPKDPRLESAWDLDANAHLPTLELEQLSSDAHVDSATPAADAHGGAADAGSSEAGGSAAGGADAGTSGSGD